MKKNGKRLAEGYEGRLQATATTKASLRAIVAEVATEQRNKKIKKQLAAIGAALVFYYAESQEAEGIQP